MTSTHLISLTAADPGGIITVLGALDGLDVNEGLKTVTANFTNLNANIRYDTGANPSLGGTYHIWTSATDPAEDTTFALLPIPLPGSLLIIQ